MNNDEYTYKEMLREMEKHVAEKAAEDAKKLNNMVLKMNIQITRPIFYGSVNIDLGKPCDYDRGSRRNRTYHVTFEGRGADKTLCGRAIWRKRLWVAYLEPGEDTEPPYNKKLCKTCAAQEDYILHQLAVT